MADEEATTFELELEPGRTVRFRELTVEQFESVVKQTDKGGDWELVQNGLRRSIVQDGDEKLDYQKLTGVLLTKRFKTRQMMLLRGAWSRIHLPSEEEQARVRDMRVVAG